MYKTLTLKYKCRICGACFGGLTGGDLSSPTGYLWQLCCAGRITEPLPGDGFAAGIKMFDIHSCPDGSKGIGDLIGGVADSYLPTPLSPADVST